MPRRPAAPPSGPDLPDHVRRRRRRVLGTALSAGLLWALALVAAVLLAAWFLAGPGGWGQGTPAPLVLVLLATLGAASLMVVLGRAGWQRGREERFARSMDEAAGLPRGTVQAHLELHRLQPGDPLLARGTASVVEVLSGRGGVRGQASRERPVLPEERQMSRWFFRAALGAGILLPAVALLALAAPDRAGAAWGGLLHPLALMEPAPLPSPTLEPAGGPAPRGEALEVLVVAPDRGSVTLVHRARGAPAQRVRASLVDGRARVSLPVLDAPTRVQVEAPDGGRSEEYEFVPADPPVLEGLELQVEYPGWTLLPPERRPGFPSALEVPEGTVLVLRGQADARIHRIRLEGAGEGGEGEPGSTVEAEPESGGFELRWTPETSSVVTLVPLAESDLPARSPRPLRLQVVPSPPPGITLYPLEEAVAPEARPGDDGVPTAAPAPARELDAPGNLRVQLRMEAVHPWALDWIELEVEVGGADEPQVVMERVSVPPGPTLVHGFELDLSPFAGAPGGVVTVRARAAEASPAGRTATSPDLRIRLPAGGEQRTAASLERDDARSAAEELRDRTTAGAAELRERAARESARASRSPRGEPATEDELRSFAGEVEARMERGRGMDALDPADREADREALEALADAVEDRTPSLARLAELREELARTDDALAEALEESLGEMERAALEAGFREAREAAEDWSREAGADADPEALQVLEEELRDRLEELEEALARQEEARGDEDAGTRRAGEALREAREAMERAGERMEQAREAAAAGDDQGAREEAGAASEEADRAAEALEQARMDWLEDWALRLRASLLRAAGDALALAVDQGHREGAMEAAGAGGVEGFLEEQLAALESARGLSRAVTPLARQVGAPGRRAREAAGGAVEAVTDGVDRLRSGQAPRGGPATAAARAHAGLNELADALMEAAESLLDDDPAAPPEGGGDPSAVEDAADGQQAVNEETAALADDQAAGEGTSAEQMENVAAGQQAVADALGGLAEEAARDEGDGDGIRFDEMQEEAGTLAEWLRDGRLDPELLDRQSGLLERLLEAGRTLERGRTEEREGVTPGPFVRLPVTPLDPGLLRGPDVRRPSRELLEGLSPRERALVLRWLDGAVRSPASAPEGRP